VAQVEEIAGGQPGAWIALALGHARALVAEPAEAGKRFDEALANDLTRWPFQRARIQLTYGQWLRRQRRVAESRTVLRAARDTFDALGCQRWSEHARRELRASGERSRRRVPAARDQLTAQELQIAQLAAAACRTAKSASGCTSRIARSARTCTGCSRSSGSPPVVS